MMFFVQHLQIYAPKNRAWKKVCDYVAKYENVLVRDELALDALKEEIRLMVEKTNVEHPKLKSIRYSAGNCGNKLSRFDASVDKMGCPDMVFIMDICRVRSTYQFCEKGEKGAIE